jgi:hypothetical protein
MAFVLAGFLAFYTLYYSMKDKKTAQIRRAGEIINGRSPRPACFGSSFISFDTTQGSFRPKIQQHGPVYPVHGG